MKIRRDIYKLQNASANRLEHEKPAIRLYNTPESDAVPYAHLIVITYLNPIESPDFAIHVICASVADVKWHLWYYYKVSSEQVERMIANSATLQKDGCTFEVLALLPLGLMIEEMPQHAKHGEDN